MARVLPSRHDGQHAELPLIDFDAVSKTYRTSSGDEIRALDRVDLSIRKGEFLSIVGPSGCGKSTLIKILAGLTGASSGTARVAGDVSQGPRPDIGIVFQEATLLPWHTILRNVLVPTDIARIPRARVKGRA